jgi:hypothetical protein
VRSTFKKRLPTLLPERQKEHNTLKVTELTQMELITLVKTHAEVDTANSTSERRTI